MIISHKFKFIFIKTAKTAGTSLEIFLSRLCGQDDIVTPIYPSVPEHHPRNHTDFYNHIEGEKIRGRVGSKIWDEYFKFCVERNPWDKTISHWCMEKARQNGTLSLDAYLENGALPINFPKYTEPTDSNKIIVNRIVFYENLIEELTDVFRLLGIPFHGSLNANAKAEYRTDRRPYQEIFNSAQAAFVADACSHEIRLHGYSYDRPQGKP